ncbi:aminoglycoside phosphotransferase family protein [Cohnella luojiensis]|uniref:Aminoglycoside phosphotransferase family protein n=1 Tax=Cohnella luojiensis TaxID=652876 RepID=A0A4Y8MB09_9BACL|nr:aminoglycoside phosphotransferase family protein [Cohnella luojiensis]TFE31577.1 aminoglycoside phosphotransferase family protein [Cohnella luojiensis]
MIPEKMLSFRGRFPDFEEVIGWQLLRKWSLSEVYRMTFATGNSRIAKWGGNEMAREMDIYLQLLKPLQIRSPQIYDCHKDFSGGFIVMEDAGEKDLEQQPFARYFIEAAKELARMRKTAAASLERDEIPMDIRNYYSVTSADFLAQLEELLASKALSDNPIIQRTREWFPEQLERLYREQPLTLVHHDFHAKNLLVQGERILIIDWSNAYLSPHLGDLYCLAKEASSFCGLTDNEIMDAYITEFWKEESSRDQLAWQLKIGGICWLIRTIKWLVYGGTDAIPGSEAWIPDLLADMEKLLDDSALTDNALRPR